MNNPEGDAVTRAKLNLRAYLVLALLLIGNAATSSVITLMGYYIVTDLKMSPWAISIYTVIVTVISVGLNKSFGNLIDSGVDVRRLLFISVFSFCCASVILNFGVGYHWLIVLVAPLFALANSSLSVMYTFGRLYAERHHHDVQRYNAFLRMNTSTGWIIGPSIAFGVLGIWGIQASFLVSLLLGLLWMIVWAIAIPDEFRHAANTTNKSTLSGSISFKLRIAAVACMCFAATNILFTASMPIYLIEEVGLPEFTPGMSFAIKCIVEIPVIYWATYLAKRWGDQNVLKFSALLGLVVMLLMTTVKTAPMLAAYAVLEGVYYGLFAGTAVGFMQSFANGRMGRATSIYISSLFVGGMIGTVSVGVVASIYGFIGSIYLAAITACMAFVAVTCLKYSIGVRHTERSE